MIHPPSGPFVRQGLAAAQRRPLSQPRVIETWLPKADLLCLSLPPPRLSPAFPAASEWQAGCCVNKGVCPPGARGGPGTGYLAGGRGAPPGSCLTAPGRPWAQLLRLGSEAPSPTPRASECVSPGPDGTEMGHLSPTLHEWGNQGPEKGGCQCDRAAAATPGCPVRPPQMALGWG